MSLSSQEIGDLLKTIEEMSDRIGRLERGRNPVGNIPQGDSIVVIDKDDSSSVIGRIGTAGDGSDDVVQLGTGAVAMDWRQNDGMRKPFVSYPAVLRAGALYPTTTNVFETVQDMRIQYLPSRWVSIEFVVVPSGGTCTGEVRLVHQQTGTVTPAVAVATGTIRLYSWFWDVSTFLALFSGPHTFQVQARRTSVAGTVQTFQSFGLVTGDFATQSGGGVQCVVTTWV